MIELTAAERLKVHLMLFFPHIKVKHVRLSATPGFLELPSGQQVDIRGASYGNDNSPLRLWNELHKHFTQNIEVLKRKNNLPTLIAWNGMIYHLDQTKSFSEELITRRSLPKRRVRIETKQEATINA